ncbi:MAG TPA: cytochrome P450 [Candidatus Kryptonia bacterium]|nr:cytochrome P450 [Candidatus Kryptonia bacterium]
MAASLDEIFGGHFMSEVRDPYPAYARLRRDEPVKLLDLPLAPGYIVTRFADVMTVLKDNALFSSHANANGIGLVMGRTILEMDGTEHARHRNIVAPAFVPKALQGGDLPTVVARFAHDMIDGFARDGRADLVSQFTRTFPLRVIAHLIGVPIEDYGTFKRWSLDLIGFADDPPKGFEAAGTLVEYLKPIVAARKAEPRGDLLSTITHAEVDGERLTDDEVYSFLKLLLPAGSDTTYRLIGSMLYALLTHRDQFEEVYANRAEIAWAIEETLRWEAPVQFASRETTAPTTLAGVELPAGAPLLTAIGSANRDQQHFPDADRFDIHRHADDHVAFGFGRHFCVGSHLARLEARTAMNALLDRLPNLRLDPSHDSYMTGLAFRSPKRLPVRFDH